MLKDILTRQLNDYRNDLVKMLHESMADMRRRHRGPTDPERDSVLKDCETIRVFEEDLSRLAQ